MKGSEAALTISNSAITLTNGSIEPRYAWGVPLYSSVNSVAEMRLPSLYSS